MNFDRYERTLEELISSRTLRTMSGARKLAYKYAVCSVFNNIIVGNDLQYGQDNNIAQVVQIRDFPAKSEFPNELLELHRKVVTTWMEEHHFHHPTDPETLTKVIEFFRKRLKESRENGVSLFLASELESFLDVKAFFDSASIPVEPYHWVEFSVLRGLTPTYPTIILLTDLKYHWNQFVDVHTCLTDKEKGIKGPVELSKHYASEEVRMLSYSIGTLYRTLIFTAVTYVESYLYDLFYNIKQGVYPRKAEVETALNIERITDKQIIEQVIWVLFPSIKNDSIHKRLYKSYKEILAIRDRYVHASAFMDQSNRTSKMHSLLQVNVATLQSALTTCVELALKIDEKLPEELKLLYWWGRFHNDVNFGELKKLSLTNPVSPMGQKEYFPEK